MATAAVDIPIRIPGFRQVQQLERQMESLGKDIDKVAVKTPKATNQIKRFGDQAKKTESKVDGLTKTVRGFLTAAALIGTAKFVIGKTAELETQTRSLQVLTGELETAKRVVSELQSFAAVTPFTSSELIESAKRLKAFGVDTEKLVATTQRLADVSGATGARLNEVATAYGQIQAKGRLQGEELLQLQERGIALQDELQKMYGLTGEEFSKALQKGQFSAEAVEVAIKRLTEAGGKYADGAISQSDTLAGKFSTLIDGIENIARTLGNVLSPALKTILDQAIGVVNSINAALAAGRRMQQFGIDAGRRNELFQQAGREAEDLTRLRNGGNINAAEFTRLRDERFRDLIEGFGYETGQIEVEIKPVIAENDIPDLLNNNKKTGGTGSSGGGGGGGGTSAADILADQMKAGKELMRQLEREAALRAVVGDEAKQILKIEYERQDLIKQINETAAESQKLQLTELANSAALAKTEELKKKFADEALAAKVSALSSIEDEIALQKAIVTGAEEEYKWEKMIHDLKNSGVSGAEAEAKVGELRSLTEQAEAYQQLQANVESLSSSIAGNLTGAFKSVIDGSKSMQEAMSDALAGIGQAFIDMAMQIIQQQMAMIVNGLIMKALGVTMPGAGASMPMTGGLDFSSAFSGGTGVPNFFGFANGGTPPMDQPSIIGERGPELFIPNTAGRVVSNEAMGAYSPGGNGGASGGASGPINISYSGPTLNFNGDDYIPRSEAPKLVEQGAKAGEARTMNSLRNSRTARSRVGV